MGKSPWLLFLKFKGIRLNICAPLTAREEALAFLTAADVLFLIVVGIAFLPVLVKQDVNSMLYPHTKP